VGTIFTPSVAGSYAFAGAVDDGANHVTGVTSNMVTVMPSDSTPPSVTVGGAPALWQNTNATATITCNDGIGVGCEFSANWKFITPQTNPGTCPTTLSSYTGFYPGPFLIEEHLWMCATAADANRYRGYTSTPVEFKVDKTDPSAPIMSQNLFPILPIDDFSVPVTDGDAGGSGITCFYHIFDSGVDAFTKAWATRTCNSDLTITVGPDKDCRTPGGLCSVYVFAKDGARNVGPYTRVTFQIGKKVCLKTATKPQDAASVTVATAVGTKQCTVTVEHLGRDDSDTGAERDNVSYETLAFDLNGVFPDSRKIGMDDDPSSGCDNDIKFTNEWTPGNGTLSVKSTKNEFGTFFKPTTHNLEYGYRLTANNCAFLSFAKENCTRDNTSVSSCASPIISGDGRSVESVQLWSPSTKNLIIDARYQYTLGGCTQAAHCTADPNKAKCNLTTNTCVDSVPPTSKITQVDDLVKKPGVRLNYPSTGDSSAFLNAYNGGNTKKTWWVQVEDSDNGVACTSSTCTCKISINGGEKSTRNCNSWATFTVGKDDLNTPLPEANCVEEGDDKCTIKVWAEDNAGNTTITKNVNSITFKEKDYIDGVVTRDANEFTFSVDWTPPTAQ
jgi:hypothetical protein